MARKVIPQVPTEHKCHQCDEQATQFFMFYLADHWLTFCEALARPYQTDSQNYRRIIERDFRAHQLLLAQKKPLK